MEFRVPLVCPVKSDCRKCQTEISGKSCPLCYSNSGPTNVEFFNEISYELEYDAEIRKRRRFLVNLLLEEGGFASEYDDWTMDQLEAVTALKVQRLK